MQPIRIIRNLQRQSALSEGEPYQFIECVQSIFNIDGVATPVAPGNTLEYDVPDIYGRPWAENWRKYHEQGMQGEPEPKSDDIFNFDQN